MIFCIQLIRKKTLEIGITVKGWIYLSFASFEIIAPKTSVNPNLIVLYSFYLFLSVGALLLMIAYIVPV